MAYVVDVCVYVFSLSDGASGLELPDLATEPLTQVIRGMSRRRPPPTFNVSTFEKQLDQPSGTKLQVCITEHRLDINFNSGSYRTVQDESYRTITSSGI